MKLTTEQELAVNAPGSILLVACPGSGKTRAIVAKLLRAVEMVRGSPRRVACITYTNAAVHEIEHRLRMYGATGDEEYCEVSTIHAFCLNNILRHFYWKLPECAGGFTVLPTDSVEFVSAIDEISDKFGLDAYARDAFESLNRKPNGSPITSGFPVEAAFAFWNLLQANGYLDFCNLVYYSYRLLNERPSICMSLASRFASILVDEFQDTTALQVEILKMIAAHGRTSFFLVGDPEQSIYSFAGAERELMFEFAASVGAKELPLSGNFRSSKLIIACAERLINRTPPMWSAGTAAAYIEEPVCEHTESCFAAISDTYLPTIEGLGIPLGKCAILAQSWFQLRPLGQRLREFGVPVVGPGARPYKRQHLFARLAEQVCAYLEHPSAPIIRQTEKELFNILCNVTGRADFRVFSYDGRRVVFRLLKEARRLRQVHEGAAQWLHAAADVFGEILFEEGFWRTGDQMLLTDSALDMLQDMKSREVDVANLALFDLGMFASPENNLKLLTVHAAKGREFMAVAIVQLHDGHIPYHNKYSPLTAAGLEEARRLLYVGITRAQRLLMVFTHSDNWRPKCRFLSELGY